MLPPARIHGSCHRLLKNCGTICGTNAFEGRLLPLTPCITNSRIGRSSLIDLTLTALHRSLDRSGSINELGCDCVCKIFDRVWTSGVSDMKARTGSIVKRKPRRKGAKPTWWARATYIDSKTGKRHDLQRRGQQGPRSRFIGGVAARD